MAKNSEKRRLRKKKEREKRVQQKLGAARARKSVRGFANSKVGKDFSRKFGGLSAADQNLVIRTMLANEKSAPHIVPSKFPRNAREMGKYGTPINSSSLSFAISLARAILSNYESLLLRFLRLRQKYETDLVKGDLEYAQKDLDEIQGAFGVSMWAFEAAIQLGELKSGIEGNRKALSSIQKQKPQWLTNLLITFFSQKMEKNVSVQFYRSGVFRLREDAKEAEADPEIVATVLYWLDLFTPQVVERPENILDAIRCYSLVDLAIAYEVFLSRFAHSNSFSAKRRLSAVAHAKQFFTPESLNLLEVSIDCHQEIFESDQIANLFDTFRLFYQGKYSDVVSEGIRQLKLNPTFFEYYLVVAQAASFGNLKLDSPFPSESLGSKLLSSLHSCIELKEDISEPLEQIRKIAYSLGNSKFAQRIMAFWLNALDYKAYFEPLRLSVLPCAVPWMVLSMPLKERKIIIDGLITSYGSRVNWMNSFLPKGNGEYCLPADFEPRVAEWLKAILHTTDQEREKAAECWKKLKSISNHNLFSLLATKQVVVQAIEENEFESLAREVVDSFVNNENYLIGIIGRSVEHVVENKQKVKASTQAKDLYWPLAYWLGKNKNLSQDDIYELHVGVAEFLAMHGSKKVSDFIRTKPPTTPKLFRFLFHVCTLNVLKRNYRIKNTAELHSERIEILQFVLNNAPKQLAGLARDEIADITRKELLRSAIQQVETRRISVKTEGVIESLSKDNAEQFQRFDRARTITDEELRNQLSVRDFDLASKGKVVVYGDFAHQLLKEFIEQIRDEFVGNTSHGLNTYIAVNVRHGHLSSQIRSQFDQHHLATRGKAGEYQDNLFWQDVFAECGPETWKKANALFIQFSLELDTLIEEVNGNWIRIRSDKHPDGMLDYSISEQEVVALFFASQEKKSYRELVDLVIDLLWIKTEGLLESIRDRISGELLPRILSMLDKLDAGINSLSPDIANSEFPAKTVSCRTAIQNDFELLLAWFTRSTDETIAKFDLDLLLEAATNALARLKPTANFIPNVKSKAKLEIQGSWFNPFYEILVMLFVNIVEHSGKNSHRPSLSFSFDGENSLRLEVVNGMSENTNFEFLQERVNLINSQLESVDPERLLSERNSGLAKVRKLMLDDLKQVNSALICSCDHEELTFSVSMALNDVRLIAE